MLYITLKVIYISTKWYMICSNHLFTLLLNQVIMKVQLQNRFKIFAKFMTSQKSQEKQIDIDETHLF